MYPQEEIVRVWLEEEGFLTMSNIRVGRREIDLLAMHPVTGEKRHIEVHVSVKPVGRIRSGRHVKISKQSLSKRVGDIVQRKFEGAIRKRVKKLLGTGDYKCYQVWGKIRGDDPDDVVSEFKKHDVEVVYIKDIIDQLKQKFKQTKRTYQDEVRKYVQLLDEFTPS